MDVPEVQYARAGDGHRLAWQQWGSGPDVFVVPPLISNCELIWEQELYRRGLEYQGDHVRVTAFDKRGIGLSDRFDAAPTLEQRCDDMLTVMDAAGLERVTLVGFSEGGLMSQLFTVLYPERVERLVLGSSHPGLRAAVEFDPDLHATLEKFGRLIEEWGADPQWFVDWFNPSQKDNAAFVRWTGRFQRLSATSADIGRQAASIAMLDASDRLGEIAVPTLVTHDVGDAVVPVAAGRWLAEQIPGATYVETPGSDHINLVGPDWRTVTDAHLEFICGSIAPARSDRTLATIVFTDIVGSTARTATDGDEQWRRTLDGHDRVAWATANRHRGVVVKATGDGFLLRFDSPSPALEFARDFRHEVSGLGVPIRCGMHMGEIEVRADGDIAGVAVNLAARVEQAAVDGEILVSSTVRDLMLGGDVHFEDRGEHSLKGFDSPWRFYALAN
ncbi:MAG: alpha/beta fold hydrolase [Actinobacteria bacterium]|nr:MAG: alpha/beta fold hydrolase [Actinomycetota bacterium]